MQTKLVEENLQLVHYMLKNFYVNPRWGIDYEDLFQIGCIGLVKAAKKFDDKKGSKFSSLACVSIRNEIIQFLDYQSRKKRNSGKKIMSLDAEIDSAEDVTLGEGIPCKTNVLEEVEARLLYKDLLKKDTWKIVPLLEEGYSSSEIANKIGVSKTTVNNWRNKLRKAVEV